MRSSAPPRGCRTDSAPPSWRISTNSSSDPELGPRCGDQGLDRPLGEVGEKDAVGVDRGGGLRVEVEARDRGGRDVVEGVELGQ